SCLRICRRTARANTPRFVVEKGSKPDRKSTATPNDSSVAGMVLNCGRSFTDPVRLQAAFGRCGSLGRLQPDARSSGSESQAGPEEGAVDQNVFIDVDVVVTIEACSDNAGVFAQSPPLL